MDLSALIFVALAVAWAAYLIPKALKHHEEAVRSRSVDRFSHSMRVLARREPTNRRNARMVVTPTRVPSSPLVTTKHSEPAVPDTVPVPREVAVRAARRRRRVLGLVLLAGVAVVVAAALGVVAWWYTGIPAGLLVAWLVCCRLMVRRERRGTPARRRVPLPAQAAVGPAVGVTVEPSAELTVRPAAQPVTDDLADTGQIPAVVDADLWDPMPVTLPTYVTKPAASRRSVRTIDLDSTGVWTSGRTDADAELAREADEAEKATRAHRQQGDDTRAVGT